MQLCNPTLRLVFVSGLSPGDYRVAASNPNFETKEIAMSIGTTGALAPLRISLAVGSVSTTINVQGRKHSLIGIAESATQGTVGAAEIQDRPILRSGEILETIPGVIVTQHAGGGKANQYFLRGFNLDHGTDFAVFLDGMPLNLPSHAHGEGYADMNTVIPEFVERMDFEKGPYYADIGNYGSAGSANLVFFQDAARRTSSSLKAVWMALGGPFSAYRESSARATCCSVERPITTTAPGSIRIIITNSMVFSPTAGATMPDGFRITARGYHGTWHSSDQIAAMPCLLSVFSVP